MTFDFETAILRKGTGCIKFDRKPDLDPYWVADMDFASAPCILEALHARVDHGVFGYAQPHQGLESAIAGYLRSRHGAVVPAGQIVHLGGIVPALSLAARAFCQPGESLMTCTPVYPPFLGVHHDAHAGLISVDHIRSEDGGWTFDWTAMEEAVRPDTRVFFLCNPQNPLGQVFPAAIVERVADFCERHDLVLVSDEIHCDLILEDSISFASALGLPDRLKARTIVLLSPSKTWNIAGLGYAYAVIPDDSLRRRFCAARGHTLAEINALGYYAAEAAYAQGEPWRKELVTRLRSNRDLLVNHIRDHCPQLLAQTNEATYLAWIDASGMNVDNPAGYFEQNAGLFLSDGAFFGWPQWFRMNFGCPRARLIEGLEKLTAALPPR